MAYLFLVHFCQLNYTLSKIHSLKRNVSGLFSILYAIKSPASYAIYFTSSGGINSPAQL